MKKLLAFCAVLGCLSANAETPKGLIPIPENFVKALKRVESGAKNGLIYGDFDKKTGKYLAIGIYQIHFSYWKDATDYDKSIGGKYEDCQIPAYALKVITAYFNRYEKKAIQNKDYESLARAHNGGNSWRTKRKKTDGYWGKVKILLK